MFESLFIVYLSDAPTTVVRQRGLPLTLRMKAREGYVFYLWENGHMHILHANGDGGIAPLSSYNPAPGEFSKEKRPAHIVMSDIAHVRRQKRLPGKFGYADPPSANSRGGAFGRRGYLPRHNFSPASRSDIEDMEQASRTLVTQAFSYALDPTSEQEELFRSHVGGSRFAYNHLLQLVSENWAQVRTEKENGEQVTEYLPTRHFGLVTLWNSHKADVAPWHAENSTWVYNDAAQKLSSAFENFYKKRAGFPSNKMRGNNESVRFPGQALRLIDRHHVRLPKIGVVKTYESMRKMARRIENGNGRIIAATLKQRGGNWFLVFTCEVQRTIPTRVGPKKIIGVDVGIKTLYTGATPEGEPVLEVSNLRNYVKAKSALTRAQRVTSRRVGPSKGQAPSKRWIRANKRVQKIHAGIRNRRLNLIHETTTHLAKNYDVIVIEDLNVAGMLHNRHLAKHISDASFGEFRRQLEYKTEWYGSTLVLADRWYPSSKTCSKCGAVRTKLSLSEREYECNACGTRIDRDLNAAVNLARLGEPAGTHSVAGRGGTQKTRATSVALAAPCETSTETEPQGSLVGGNSAWQEGCTVYRTTTVCRMGRNPTIRRTLRMKSFSTSSCARNSDPTALDDVASPRSRAILVGTAREPPQ